MSLTYYFAHTFILTILLLVLLDLNTFYVLSNGHKGDTYLHQLKILETKEVIYKILIV